MSNRLPSVRLMRVKYLPATDTKGARYSIRALGKQLTAPADYSLTPEQNARKVLDTFLEGRPVESVGTVIDRSKGFRYMVYFAATYRLTFTLEA